MSLENLQRAVERARTGERKMSKAQVIDDIKFLGLEDPGVIKLVSDYTSEKRAEFEKENPKTAEVELALHMADIYLKAGLVDIAMTNMESAMKQAEDTHNDEAIQKVHDFRGTLIEAYKA